MNQDQLRQQTLEKLVSDLGKCKGDEVLAPGTGTQILACMKVGPASHVMTTLQRVREEEDRGRHGFTREEVLTSHGFNTNAMNKLCDQMDVDYVTAKLIQRRGNDGDLPIPEPDRRDHIRAALDASNFSEE